MKKAGKDHLLTLVQYPEAGHLIEPPYMPHFRATRFNKSGEREATLALFHLLAFLNARLCSSDCRVGGNHQTSFGCSGRLLEEDPGVFTAAPVLRADSPSKDVTVQSSQKSCLPVLPWSADQQVTTLKTAAAHPSHLPLSVWTS